MLSAIGHGSMNARSVHSKLLHGLFAAWIACIAVADAAPYAGPFHSFLAQHCEKCHSGAKPKGDWRVDELTAAFSGRASRDRWHSVQEKIESGEMPPKSKPRPPAAEVQALARWITSETATADAALRGREGRVVLRRLNRAEYENTVNDLLGVQASLKDLLPLDTAANGFDNVGDALHTSSFLIDQYLIAADTALNQAIVNHPAPKVIKLHCSLAEARQIKSTKQNVFRKSDGESVVMFTSSPWQAATLSPFYPADRGIYRFRICASGVQSQGRPVVFSVTSGSGGMGGAKAHLVGYFDAPPDKSMVIQFTDYMEPKTSINILPYGLASAQAVDRIGAAEWSEPGLAVDWVEVEGPIHDSWPPESHRRIFGDLEQREAPIFNQKDRLEVVSHEPAQDADRILRQFARRAFRRPVTDADIMPYDELVQAKIEEGQS
ncbi:MAG TPA: DUF1587 domain-containing protein, partial [Verrucomicrobiaceae bacterium]